MEHPIEYGDAFERCLTCIYNMRRLHPWIAPAFSFLFFGTLYVPTGQVFGSNTSAQNFEPFAKARTLLARHTFETEDCVALVAKYNTL